MMQQQPAGGVASLSMAVDQSQTQRYQQQPQRMMSQQQQMAVSRVVHHHFGIHNPFLRQQYSAGSAAAGTGEIRSLWIGDLRSWMDENYLISVFAHTGEVLSTKVIRNKQTGLPEGYGFIEFVSRAAAERFCSRIMRFQCQMRSRILG